MNTIMRLTRVRRGDEAGPLCFAEGLRVGNGNNLPWCKVVSQNSGAASFPLCPSMANSQFWEQVAKHRDHHPRDARDWQTPPGVLPFERLTAHQTMWRKDSDGPFVMMDEERILRRVSPVEDDRQIKIWSTVTKALDEPMKMGFASCPPPAGQLKAEPEDGFDWTGLWFCLCPAPVGQVFQFDRPAIVGLLQLNPLQWQPEVAWAVEQEAYYGSLRLA